MINGLRRRPAETIFHKYETCFILQPCAILRKAQNNRAALDVFASTQVLKLQRVTSFLARLCRKAA
jgi:hypothetical protein